LDGWHHKAADQWAIETGLQIELKKEGEKNIKRLFAIEPTEVYQAA
jgi:hypothetical protein